MGVHCADLFFKGSLKLFQNIVRDRKHGYGSAKTNI